MEKQIPTYNPNQVDLALLKKSLNDACRMQTKDKGSRDMTDHEFDSFVYQCKRTNLDPLTRQIYAVWRHDSRQGKAVMGVQVSIDGFRIIAERTGTYQGQEPTLWQDHEGNWHESWIKDGKPAACKVGVNREGFRGPLWAVATWKEYSKTFGLWQTLPAVMLAKCAESLALRKAFPAELSGLYTAEEMSQAEVDAPDSTPPAAGNPAPKSPAPAPKTGNKPLSRDHRVVMKWFISPAVGGTKEDIEILKKRPKGDADWPVYEQVLEAVDAGHHTRSAIMDYLILGESSDAEEEDVQIGGSPE